MVITYYGMASVKVQFGDTVIAFNPVSKEAEGVASTRFGADIALVSLRDPYYNGVDQVSYGEKKPFVIRGPGEYEVKGIYSKGVPSVASDDRINTIYTVLLEGITLCHAGALASADLAPEVIEQIGEVDILFLPVWNDGVLTPAAADKVATLLEPKCIIPLYQGPEGEKESAKHRALFLKEAGEDKSTPVEKLTLKKKDLEGKEGEVIVLVPER